MSATPPDSVSNLRQQLLDQGFEESGSGRGDAGFGSGSIDLVTGDLVVKLVSDRGQWFVEAGAAGWNDAFDADVWESCLKGGDAATEPRGLDAQAAWFAANASTLRERLDDDTLSCLQRNRRSRASRRLGVQL